MTDPNPDVKSVFGQAAEIADPHERAAFLDRVCAGQPAVRAEVEELLRALGDAGSFMAAPAVPPGPTGAYEPPAAEGEGGVIGPYTLREQIGEGGFGLVFVAEQQQPVRRKVALKVIKPGMDSRQVLARFEAERQALALMDHPNIARILDAGTTERGRPYFVMELIRGTPITEYADANRLPPRERLLLFVQVCQAVQHAHQKGVIHRDLKPSNILVAPHDGVPVVKVIDFGVAKALGQSLTDRTVYTRLAQMIGTPLYMSPEQAEVNQLDADTRSDVYSLGVLLYELLTGTTPFDRDRFAKAAFDEIQRIIKEEEPPTPSKRLTSLGATLSAVSVNRGTDPARLAGLVRGELDWIAMKCLQKDRSRRYDTAAGLARDVERYLRDEPVEAGPESLAYRLRKFVRRHKRTVATAALLGVTLLAAVVAVAGTVGWATRDRAAREQRIAQEATDRRTAVEREVAQALEETTAWYGRDNLAEARAALKRAEGLLLANGLGGDLAGKARRWRADLDMVERVETAYLERLAFADGRGTSLQVPFRQAFLDYGLDVPTLDPAEAGDRIKSAAIRDRLVSALDSWALGPSGDGDAGRQRLLQIARRADDDPWRDRLRSALLRRDADTLQRLGSDQDLARQPPRTVILLAKGLADADCHDLAAEVLRAAHRRHPADFWINYHLGSYLERLEEAEREEGLAYLRVAVALNPGSSVVRVTLAGRLLNMKRVAEAEAEARTALAIAPHHSSAHLVLAMVLNRRGRSQEADSEYREALRLRPTSAANYNIIANHYRDQKQDYATAAQLYREAIRLAPADSGLHLRLADVLARLRKYAEAEAEYREALRLAAGSAWARSRLVNMLEAQGKWAEAEAVCRQALHDHPHDPSLRYQLAEALRRQEKLPEAEKECRELLRLAPGHPAATCELGVILLKQNRLEEAEAQFRDAIRLLPSAFGYRNLLVQALRQQGKLTEAEKALEDAVRDFPNNPAFQSGLLAVQTQIRQAERLARAREDVKNNPRDLRFRVSLASTLRDQGKYAEAEAEYREAGRLGAAVSCPLGEVLLAQGKFAEAEAAFREAVRLHGLVDAHLGLGRSHARRGQWALAAASLARGLELAPKQSAQVWHQAGLAQLAAGDREGYRRSCREMRDRFAGGKDRNGVALTVGLWALVPDEAGGVEALLAGAERIQPGSEAERGYPFRVMVKALGYARGGRPAEALETLKVLAPQPDGGRMDARILVTAALARHALGQQEEARTALAEARKILTGAMPDPDAGRYFDDGWFDWLHCQILVREAQRLIEPDGEKP